MIRPEYVHWITIAVYGSDAYAYRLCFLSRTHIISDKFDSYVSTNESHTLTNNKDLKHMSYKHTWVNHSKNFVDPKTGAHTNSIEGCWEAKLKRKITVSVCKIVARLKLCSYT